LPIYRLRKRYSFKPISQGSRLSFLGVKLSFLGVKLFTNENKTTIMRKYNNQNKKGLVMIENIDTKKRGRSFKKQQTIDPNTGELHEILLIGNPEEFDRNFTKIFHAFTEALIEDEDIAGKAIRLLFWIMKELENGSIEFYMDYKTIKKELGIGETTYHRWKKTLEKKGIIRKIKVNLYQLNPACVVKGKGHTLLEEFRQPKLPGIGD